MPSAGVPELLDLLARLAQSPAHGTQRGHLAVVPSPFASTLLLQGGELLGEGGGMGTGSGESRGRPPPPITETSAGSSGL